MFEAYPLADLDAYHCLSQNRHAIFHRTGVNTSISNDYTTFLTTGKS
jgi:hypothetical protein